MDKSMTKYNQLVKTNLNRNFIANITDGVFFSFGLGFISMTTILPYFVSQLTDSKFLISLIVSIFMLGSTIPQLFAANSAETFKKKKKAVIIIGIFHRLPFLFLFIFTFLISDTNNNLLLILFYFSWTLYSMATGTVVPFWFDMLTKVIPVNIRGKFFGYQTFIGSILEVVGASIAGIIIKNYIFPVSFNIIFGLTTLALSISFIALFFIKEPEYPRVKRRIGISNYLENLKKIIEGKINFRYYLISIFFTEFIGMVNGLFTVAGIERLDLSGGEAAALVSISTIILITCQSVSSVFWGYISDNIGHKKVLLFTAVFNMLGVIMALLANYYLLYYLVFVFTGLAMGGTRVSFLAIIPEFCSQEDVPGFVALTNTTKGLTVAFIALLGGLLADLYDYEIVFIIASIMIFTGIIILKSKVIEPRFDK